MAKDLPKLKEVPDYVKIDPNFKPKPKNGHYSEIDPTFATMKPAVDAGMAALWNFTEWKPFREAWLNPGPMPEGCPTDTVTELKKVPVRDGAEVEIKIYKSPRVKKDAVLIVKTHGGGWAIGSHVTEEGDNHMVAGNPGVVVVSVDYRL